MVGNRGEQEFRVGQKKTPKHLVAGSTFSSASTPHPDPFSAQILLKGISRLGLKFPSIGRRWLNPFSFNCLFLKGCGGGGAHSKEREEKKKERKKKIEEKKGKPRKRERERERKKKKKKGPTCIHVIISRGCRSSICIVWWILRVVRKTAIQTHGIRHCSQFGEHGTRDRIRIPTSLNLGA